MKILDVAGSLVFRIDKPPFIKKSTDVILFVIDASNVNLILLETINT